MRNVTARKRTALVNTLLLGAVVVATPVHGESNLRQVTREAVACQSQDEFERIVRLAADGDDQAATKLLAAGIIAGRCTVLKPGQRVYLENVKPLWSRVLVRPQGEPASVWTYSRAIN